MAIDSQDNITVAGQTATITNTVISNNKAESAVSNTFGGGVIVRAPEATVTLAFCTVSNNQSNATSTASTCPQPGATSPCAGFAGGLYNQQAHMIVNNTTVSGNTSSHHHAGIQPSSERHAHSSFLSEVSRDDGLYCFAQLG